MIVVAAVRRKLVTSENTPVGSIAATVPGELLLLLVGPGCSSGRRCGLRQLSLIDDCTTPQHASANCRPPAAPLCRAACSAAGDGLEAALQMQRVELVLPEAGGDMASVGRPAALGVALLLVLELLARFHRSAIEELRAC